MKKNTYYLFFGLVFSVLTSCSASPPHTQDEPRAEQGTIAADVQSKRDIREEIPKKEESSPVSIPVKDDAVQPSLSVKEIETVQPAPSIKQKALPKQAEQSKPVNEQVKSPIAEKTEPVKQEPVKPKAQEQKSDIVAEFGGVRITKETYDQTKTEMEKIVDKLNHITAAKDYKQWITVLSQDYQRVYAQKSTLKKVSEALPVKGIKLGTLKDYFTYVFVPSRQNIRVDDIRFLSPTRVNVIMKHGNDSLLVYELERIDESWKLIPPKL